MRWLGALAIVLSVVLTSAANTASARRRCELAPAESRAVVRVERDSLAHVSMAGEFAAPRGQVVALADFRYADSSTLLPTARVRLLRMDSAMRAALVAAQVRDSAPMAYMQARPFAGDCRLIAWPDSTPWVRVGEDGYVEGTLAPRAQWIDDRPTLLVHDALSFPYPRRYLASISWPRPTVMRRGPFASIDAFFSFREMRARARVALMQWRRGKPMVEINAENGSILREHTLTWARANVADAARAPLDDAIRQEVLSTQSQRFGEHLSRVRGTYEVQFTALHFTTANSVADTVVRWWMRTADVPLSRWIELDSARSVADVVTHPYAAGYVLPAHTHVDRESLRVRGPLFVPGATAWLSVGDRVTQPEGDTASVLLAQLRFRLGSVPERWWSVLQPYVPSEHPVDSMMRAREGRVFDWRSAYPQVRFTLRSNGRGAWVGDTTLERNGTRLRLRVTRVDSVAVVR